MDDGDILVIVFLVIAIGCFSFLGGNTYGYKKGQLDALKGKYKYEIKVDESGNETVWSIE